MNERPGAVIASLTNERVKAVVRLRDRRERDLTGLTIVDGAREVGRAVDAGVEVVALYVVDPIPAGDAAAAVAGARERRFPIVTVSAAVAERLAFGDRPDGIVAVVRQPDSDLATLAARLTPDPLLVIVDGVEKPGNIGAILRSADGAGVDGLIVTDPATDLYNPNAIRASIGTIFSVQPVTATPVETRAWLEARGIRVVAARVDATRHHSEADLTGPVAIVVGSEAEGLGAAWLVPEIDGVRLPMHGVADSLNVSVAAGILLYEARRQRGSPSGASVSSPRPRLGDGLPRATPR